MKYLVISVTKHVWDLYVENYKTPVKASKGYPIGRHTVFTGLEDLIKERYQFSTS
jgi:hypothetical protein